jgi:hypothetical protein
MAHGLLYTADYAGVVLVWRLDTYECIAEMSSSFGGVEALSLNAGLLYCYGSSNKKSYLEALFWVPAFVSSLKENWGCPVTLLPRAERDTQDCWDGQRNRTD